MAQHNPIRPADRQLSVAAASVLAVYTTHGYGRSRDIRHALPRTLSRRDYGRAWRELAELGLVPSSSSDSNA